MLSLDMCALCEKGANWPQDDMDQWLRVNFDSGSAKTVFPMTANYGEKGDPGGLSFRTATGEVVDDSGSLYVKGTDEGEKKLGLHGYLAPVHKPLASASQLVEKGPRCLDEWKIQLHTSPRQQSSQRSTRSSRTHIGEAYRGCDSVAQ